VQHIYQEVCWLRPAPNVICEQLRTAAASPVPAAHNYVGLWRKVQCHVQVTTSRGAQGRLAPVPLVSCALLAGAMVPAWFACAAVLLCCWAQHAQGHGYLEVGPTDYHTMTRLLRCSDLDVAGHDVQHLLAV
jgi:hypothetical protein